MIFKTVVYKKTEDSVRVQILLISYKARTFIVRDGYLALSCVDAWRHVRDVVRGALRYRRGARCVAPCLPGPCLAPWLPRDRATRVKTSLEPRPSCGSWATQSEHPEHPEHGSCAPLPHRPSLLGPAGHRAQREFCDSVCECVLRCGRLCRLAAGAIDPLALGGSRSLQFCIL